ncbi:hypothetical protein DPMN_094814 [Dreissena polymorpha]|uniref:Mab-21-like HhH/H2TH-like domain-containing protein n=1 Tax=Dreissena polymorpha TaxID=45954 RepID=A0A9D4L6Q6_DREPO|nr:hypothetical protein DPMN_094814 [Dreissena polymorpha]
MEKKMTSLKLDEVMEDIGVTKEIIYFRRHVHLLQETVSSMLGRPLEVNVRIFGSQSEGSTTLGMQSDKDILFTSTKYIARIDWHLPYRYASLVNNMFLVIKTAMSLPQCCSLQPVMLGDDGKIIPLTVEHIKAEIDDFCVFDHQGRALFTNRLFLKDLLSNFASDYEAAKQHGPAITLYGDQDIVFSINCSSISDDYRASLTALNQPGHWPKPETKIKANKLGLYLMAPGNLSSTFRYDPVRSAGIMHVHYASDYLNSQFRMSTNMIERLLMFDLNIVQMKTYILTKMIRIEFLKPIVGDRLSTFHMKTALLFTVETFPEDIWTKDNLVQCVLFCLITLRRFLKRRVCPHYTFSSVNLFYDKLQVY